VAEVSEEEAEAVLKAGEAMPEMGGLRRWRVEAAEKDAVVLQQAAAATPRILVYLSLLISGPVPTWRQARRVTWWRRLLVSRMHCGHHQGINLFGRVQHGRQQQCRHPPCRIHFGTFSSEILFETTYCDTFLRFRHFSLFRLVSKRSILA